MKNPSLSSYLREIPAFVARPVDLFRTYDRGNLRPDLVAGATVAVILIPQAIAYALIAELPPQMGLYAGITAAIVGALWGSSNHLHTGPTNAISLLILSILLGSAATDPGELVILAGLMAVMVGAIQIVLGLARLGALVNFVSHSVIVGFSSGAGVLIAAKQLQHLLGLQFASESLVETLIELVRHVAGFHMITLVLGTGTILLILGLRVFKPTLPGPLIGMIIAAAAVGFFGLDQQGVRIIGDLPQGIPPITRLPVFDLTMVGKVSTGALAVAAIGLVEAMSIARSLASQSGQRLNSNQEFIGQGLANLATGFLSGYPGSGSFTRSAVIYKAGGKSPMASVFSGMIVLFAMLSVGPLAAFVPRTALAGVLILTAYSMIDQQEIRRILEGTRGDAIIMTITFFGTLFLPIEFAVLFGIFASFAVYLMRTSTPRVRDVLPDDQFRHFVPRPERNPCPQLGIMDILGDLYFGAVSHVERTIQDHRAAHPEQRFLLLRMQHVNQCDISGIHALESIIRTYRERGGEVYLARVQQHVFRFMRSTHFYEYLGPDRFLSEDRAIDHLFHRILDPAICIYECPNRAFLECQNLPKQILGPDIELHTEISDRPVPELKPAELWDLIHTSTVPMVIDVREPREFQRGHIPNARPIPLPKFFGDRYRLPYDRKIVLVCRGGRRSRRAAQALLKEGHTNATVLEGGMLAWEAAGLLEAVDRLE